MKLETTNKKRCAAPIARTPGDYATTNTSSRIYWRENPSIPSTNSIREALMKATAYDSSSSDDDDDYSDNGDDEGDTGCFGGGRQVFLEPTVAFTPVHVPSRLAGRRPLLTTDDALELCRNLENLYIGDKDDGNKKKKNAEDRSVIEKGDDDIHKSYASNKRYPTLESIYFEDDECDENVFEEEIQTMGSKSKRSRPRGTKKTVTANKRCNFLNNDDDDRDIGDNQEDDETGSPTAGLFTQRVRDPQTRRIVKVKRSARLSASPST